MMVILSQNFPVETGAIKFIKDKFHFVQQSVSCEPTCTRAASGFFLYRMEQFDSMIRNNYANLACSSQDGCHLKVHCFLN